MRPVLLTSAFLPPIQYFARLYAAPTIYMERHDHYVKQTYRNRCHIAGPVGIQTLNDAIADFGVTTLGYEEDYLTVAELQGYEKHLNAKLVPFNKPIFDFRASKEEWEIDLMKKAQEITDKAFEEVLPRIRVGMSELELQAELIYCMYKNGGTGAVPGGHRDI